MYVLGLAITLLLVGATGVGLGFYAYYNENRKKCCVCGKPDFTKNMVRFNSFMDMYGETYPERFYHRACAIEPFIHPHNHSRSEVINSVILTRLVAERAEDERMVANLYEDIMKGNLPQDLKDISFKFFK